MATKGGTKKKHRRPAATAAGVIAAAAQQMKGESGPGEKKPAEFEQYALFLSLPVKERSAAFGYHTDKEFAQDKGVSVQTLSEWKYHPSQKLWKLRATYMLAMRRHTPDVLAGLAANAITKGGGFEVMVWMQLVEGYNPKATPPPSGTEDLAAIVRQEIQEAKDVTPELPAPEKPKKDDAAQTDSQ